MHSEIAYKSHSEVAFYGCIARYLPPSTREYTYRDVSCSLLAQRMLVCTSVISRFSSSSSSSKSSSLIAVATAPIARKTLEFCLELTTSRMMSMVVLVDIITFRSVRIVRLSRRFWQLFLSQYCTNVTNEWCMRVSICDATLGETSMIKSVKQQSVYNTLFNITVSRTVWWILERIGGSVLFSPGYISFSLYRFPRFFSLLF